MCGLDLHLFFVFLCLLTWSTDSQTLLWPGSDAGQTKLRQGCRGGYAIKIDVFQVKAMSKKECQCWKRRTFGPVNNYLQNTYIIWSCFLSKPRIYPPLQKCSGWASHGQEMQGHKSGAKRPLQSPGTAGAAGRGWILELQTILQFEQSQRRPQPSLSPGCTMLNGCLNTVGRCEIGTLTQFNSVVKSPS